MSNEHYPFLSALHQNKFWKVRAAARESDSDERHLVADVLRNLASPGRQARTTAVYTLYRVGTSCTITGHISTLDGSEGDNLMHVGI